MRATFIGILSAFALNTAHAAILFEHPFPSSDTLQACTSCLPQLNRAWDAFDLAVAGEITSIDALVGLDPSYPSTGTTAIELSIWNEALDTQLFAQAFLPAQLTVTFIEGSRFEILANIGPVSLPAGTYYLSIFNGSQIDALGWNLSATSVDNRSIRTFGNTYVPGDTTAVVNGPDLAFRVVGTAATVSEPATMPLTALALAGALLAGPRRPRSCARMRSARFLSFA